MEKKSEKYAENEFVSGIPHNMGWMQDSVNMHVETEKNLFSWE